MSAPQHLLMTDWMLAVFGLSHAADTLVGDAMLRGIRRARLAHAPCALPCLCCAPPRAAPVACPSMRCPCAAMCPRSSVHPPYPAPHKYSGGEKRRLTTMEMLVGPAQFIALDSVSNGGRGHAWGGAHMRDHPSQPPQTIATPPTTTTAATRAPPPPPRPQASTAR